MRLCFVLALAGAMSAAHASFELMILPNANSSVLSRWDPVSRVNLGTIGEQGGTSVMSVNQMATGNIAATSSVSSVLYEPYNGTYQGSIGTPSALCSIDPNHVTLYEAFGQNAYRYNGTTGSYISNMATGLNIYGIIGVTSTRAFVYGTNTSGDLVARGVDFSTNTLGIQTTLVNAATIPTPTLIGMGAASVNANTGGYTIKFTYRSSANLNYLTVMNYNSSMALTSYSSSALNGFGTGALCVISGHLGYYVVGDDAASSTVTRLTRFGTDNVILGSSTTSSVDVPSSRWSGANILAPEPGPFVAMGLGLAALVARRRRK